MSDKLEYPCRRWKLMPSFKPTEVELVEELRYFGDALWAETSTGSTIRIAESYPSKDAAIEAGWARVAEQQADIDKRQERLNKRRAALTKAGAK